MQVPSKDPPSAPVIHRPPSRVSHDALWRVDSAAIPKQEAQGGLIVASRVYHG